MHTLFDFMTHVKGVEYILSILFIGGFLLLWETLKPRPFATVMSAGREDLQYLRGSGSREVLRTAGRIAAAPFIGLAYVILLPVGFYLMLLSELVNLAVRAGAALLGREATFAWRPMEAYFTGRKKRTGSDNGEKKP